MAPQRAAHFQKLAPLLASWITNTRSDRQLQLPNDKADGDSGQASGGELRMPVHKNTHLLPLMGHPTESMPSTATVYQADLTSCEMCTTLSSKDFKAKAMMAHLPDWSDDNAFTAATLQSFFRVVISMGDPELFTILVHMFLFLCMLLKLIYCAPYLSGVVRQGPATRRTEGDATNLLSCG